MYPHPTDLLDEGCWLLLGGGDGGEVGQVGGQLGWLQGGRLPGAGRAHRGDRHADLLGHRGRHRPPETG